MIDSMNNKYVLSKYHAEEKVLEAIRDGLDAKIMRVGNLMGRYSDGEFQINSRSNAFLSALKGFATIGMCPISHATDPMRLSPIDLTARTIVLLHDRGTVLLSKTKEPSLCHVVILRTSPLQSWHKRRCRKSAALHILPEKPYHTLFQKSV